MIGYVRDIAEVNVRSDPKHDLEARELSGLSIAVATLAYWGQDVPEEALKRIRLLRITVRGAA